MRVLLLEDDVALCRAIEEVLLRDGMEVDTFYSGGTLLDEVKSYNYDLYILDINVPQVNGLEVLRLIRGTNPYAKIIIISSNIDMPSIERAYEYGCEDYLKKPFYLGELRLKINKITDRQRRLVDEVALKEGCKLTRMERRLLLLLLENRGRLVTYEAIEAYVYAEKTMNMDALRTMVRRLRDKLADDTIENVVGEGYLIR